MLFIIIMGMGVLLFIILSYSADMYQQEVNQRLNAAIAEHIVHDETLLKNGEVNQTALKGLFHNLMVINPSIEVYLLDVEGKILSYSAPDEKIKRTFVDLKPINQFYQSAQTYPLLGDDPRNLDGHKVFSSAPIYAPSTADNALDNGSNAKTPQGYLYVILGGETFDGITEMIRSSYILKYSVLGLVTALIIALVSGLLLFYALTHRVRTLSDILSKYLGNNPNDSSLRYPAVSNSHDEIDQLGESFNVMADRIDQQLNDLKQNDAKRRELVANVSHDLRTPLTSLHGYLETLILKDKDLSPEERNKYLKIIFGQSERLKQLITELFELAKLDSVETLLSIEPFSLAELAQDITHKFSLTASENNISINTDFNREIPFVYGDIALIQRALENLLENAIRHTPKGGSITLSLTKQQENIIVKISDTGCGIAEDDISHIFDRFYQANKNDPKNSQHSGLGLAITKKIVALHGGSITAMSDLNVGTTFSFELPTHQTV